MPTRGSPRSPAARCDDREAAVDAAVARGLGTKCRWVLDSARLRSMTVLLAHLPTPEGDAALAAAIEEAPRRDTGAVVVHVPRPADAASSPYSVEQVLDAALARFADAGVAAELREVPPGSDTTPSSTSPPAPAPMWSSSACGDVPPWASSCWAARRHACSWAWTARSSPSRPPAE